MRKEEAIKVASEMHGWLKTDREKEALETLIPELREGDSDRIRKEIISALKWANHGGVYDEHIAYMENLKPSFRQIHDGVMWDSGLRAGIELGKKKQKSLNISAASEWLRKHISNYMNSEYNEFHKCVEYDGSIDKERLINDFEEAMQKEQSLRDFIDDFPYSCEQEEQKPINESNMREPTLDEARKWNEAYEKGYSLGYENGRNEQKPAEWGDEDEKTLWGLTAYIPDEELKRLGVTRLDILKKFKSLRPQPKQEWSEEDKEKLNLVIDRIYDSLPERLNFPPKQEWGEEDERMLERAIHIISEYSDIDEKESEIVQNWLNKSLRSQPKQEWSEEDRLHYANVLEALEYVKGCKSDYDKIEAIKSDIVWFKSICSKTKQETE